jgi:hypothetical protein
MSQQITCVRCDAPLNLHIDTAGYVHEAVPGRDDKPMRRYNEKGDPVKGKKAPPLFHLRDRRQVTKQVEAAKGVFEDVATEEPNTVECPKCGYRNLIY